MSCASLLTRVLAIACAVSLGACAHVEGIARRYEVETVVAGSTQRFPDALPQLAVESFAVDPSATNGRLVGRIVVTSAGTRDIDVETRAVWSEAEYGVWTAVFARALITPFVIALLVPAYGDGVPDYDGDGEIEWTERVKLTVVMLNPFMAYPYDEHHESEHTSESVRRETRAFDVPWDVSQVPLELVIERDDWRQVLPVVASADGVLTVDMESVPTDRLTLDLKGRIEAPSVQASNAVDVLDPVVVADLLWSRGLLLSTEDAIPNDLRRAALKELDWAASAHDCPREESIERWVRLFELQNAEAGFVESKRLIDPPDLTLEEAVSRGQVEVAPRGSGFRSISVTMKNVSATSLVFRVDAGTYFRCEGEAQNMVVTTPRAISLASGQSRAMSFPAACAEMRMASPKENHTFVLGSAPDPRLVQIAPYLDLVDANTRQAVVWILTDDATLASFERYQVPAIRKREVRRAIALCRMAGVDLSDRRVMAK